MSNDKKEEVHTIEATILTDNVSLYEEDSKSSETKKVLTSDDKVIVLEKMEHFSFVEFTDDETGDSLKGYIENDSLDIINENEEIPIDKSDNDKDRVEKVPSDTYTTIKKDSSQTETKETIDSETKKDARIVKEKVARKQPEKKEVKHQDSVKNAPTVQKAKISSASQQTTFKGLALNKPTNVYASQSTQSSILKSYDQGSILKYKSLSSEWYEATVYVNGKYITGYIFANDVENITNSQSTLKGIGLDNPTKVYQKASTGSKVIKSYDQGSILKYKTLTSQWYEVTVSVHGKYTTGYILVNDIETIQDSPSAFSGIGLKSPTAVYQKASTNSKKLKTYAQGSILKYRSFTSNWYEATVYINGKAVTGYIHKSDVENVVTNQETLKGIGLQNPTSVYSMASTSSKKLKSYAQGSILRYKTFSSDWYEATIYLNGKATTGYIPSGHVDNLLPIQKTLNGRALASKTNVYLKASKNSKILKSYKKKSVLKFKSLSKYWYEATVYINGEPTTGYIFAGDVTTADITNITKYDYSLKDMVDIQMKGSPKSDGSGKIAATRAEVEYYANPLNFAAGTAGYFQFLDLTQRTGIRSSELDKYILFDKGILKGTGKAFIDASEKYNINEAYLIAHTLHETGNGTSTLAKGIPVDNKGNVTRDSNGNIEHNSKTAHTVYNMYGYGAVDSDPIKGGAKYAFDHGWFTPYDAIIGGAGSVVNSYIARGQDTLYKMRWNPISPGYPQYATHVAWAVLQTRTINEIYNMIDNYTLVFNVPQFTN